MNRIIKPQKIALLYPVLFLCMTSMFIRSWVPMFYSSWPLFLVGCTLSIFIVPWFFNTRWAWWVLAYTLIVLLNWFWGDSLFDNSSLVTNEIAQMFLFSSAIFYIISSDDERCMYWIFWTMLIMIGIAAIGSIVVNSTNPDIIRNQSQLVDEDMKILIGYYRMGLSNYLLPHGLPMIIAPLILLYKRSKGNKKMRKLSLIFLLLTLLLVYLSGSTTVLLISLLALSSFLLKDSRNNNDLLVVFTVLLLPFLLFPDAIFSLFQNNEEGSIANTYSKHFEDMINYGTKGSTGNTNTRMTLYMNSIGVFIKSPIWGTNDPISEHSVLLDRLGSLGLLGFIPLIGIIVCFIKFVRSRLDKLENSYFSVSVLCFFLMVLIKGIEDKEVWLMFFVVSPVIILISSKVAKHTQ